MDTGFWIALLVALVPNLFFLGPAYRLCQKRNLPPERWLPKVALWPGWGLAALYASIQPPERQAAVYRRVWITGTVVSLLFLFAGYIIWRA